MNLTKYRREVLWRLAEGPKTIEEARDGHPNIMPTLISNGLAHSGAGGLYELTEDGMKVVCRDALTHLAGEQGSDFSALMRAVCP